MATGVGAGGRGLVLTSGGVAVGAGSLGGLLVSLVRGGLTLKELAFEEAAPGRGA